MELTMARRDAREPVVLSDGCSPRARRVEEEEIVRRLSREISLAGLLGRCALSPGGRRRAYEVKAAKLSVALTRFGHFFRALSVEPWRPEFGQLLKVRLADFRVTRVPLWHLSAEARSLVNLSLPRVEDAAKPGNTILAAQGLELRASARGGVLPEAIGASGGNNNCRHRYVDRRLR